MVLTVNKISKGIVGNRLRSHRLFSNLFRLVSVAFTTFACFDVAVVFEIVRLRFVELGFAITIHQQSEQRIWKR